MLLCAGRNLLMFPHTMTINQRDRAHIGAYNIQVLDSTRWQFIKMSKFLKMELWGKMTSQRLDQQVTFEGRSKTLRDVDQLIKAEQHMVNTNRAASGKRTRQYRLMSSKGF